MTVAPQAEQEVVVGTIASVGNEGGDKYIVMVIPDGSVKQRKLRTNDAQVAEQLYGLTGQRLSFMCRISTYPIPGGGQGSSSWINGFGQPGQQVAAPPAQQWQPPAQQWQPPVQQQPVMQQAPQPQAFVPQAPQRDSTEDKIHRQTATKVAVHLLKHLSPEDQTFTNLIAMSERLVAYYEHGVPPVQQNPDGAGFSGDPGPQGIPHDDDQIPF